MGIKFKNHDQYPDAILVRDFIGEVGVHQIIESWEYLIGKNLIKDSTRGVINNLLGCDLCMDMNSFRTLISFLKKQEHLAKIKLAVICDKPETIVFPALGEKKETELQIKPFSTMDAAVSWVMDDLY